MLDQMARLQWFMPDTILQQLILSWTALQFRQKIPDSTSDSNDESWQVVSVV